MKIAIIAPTHIPSRHANTIQIMKMAQAFVKVGHEVHLIVPGSPPLESQIWENLAQHYGIKTQFPISWVNLKNGLKKYDFGWKACRWAMRWPADLVYTRLPQAGALSSLLGLPTIFEIHDYPQGTAGPLLFKLFLRGKGAKRVVVITKALVNDLMHGFNLQLKDSFRLVAPDGVDLGRYDNLPSPAEARKRLGLSFNKIASEKLSGTESLFIAGYSGSLYAGRGINLLISLAERLPNIHFFILGGEEQEVNHFRQIVHKRDLDNIEFYGFVSNQALPLYQAACDVLLMPYQRKVAASSGGDIGRYLSPMKVFEYMAAERAIISSNLPVLQEVLTPENAIMLPPEDINAWASALVLLKNDELVRQRLARRAREDVKEYTWEARARKILSGLF